MPASPTTPPPPRRRAALIALAVGLVAAGICAADFFWVRPLQQSGALDRGAVLFNALVTLFGLPGLLAGRLLFIVNHHVSAEAMARYYGAVSLVNGLCYGLATFWLLRRRASRDAAVAAAEPGLPSAGRREALRRTVGWSVVGGGALFGVYGVAVEPRRPVLRHLRLPLEGLPPALSGLRLVHLTDLHLGRFVSEAYLRRVAQMASALRPDLVLLTGDYVHGSGRFIDPVAAIIGSLHARLGLVGVLGNHDFWEGARHSRRALGRAGVHLLDNRALWLGPGGLSPRPVAEAGLCLAGVGDLWEDRTDLTGALEGVDPALPRLLLGHNPDFAETAAARQPGLRVDLMLAGHTHGGQVRLPGTRALITPSAHGAKYARGLVRGPAFPVHVSAGIGTTILPVRLLVPPEIVVIDLVAAAPPADHRH